jgi:putative addiction module killer protein
LSLIYDTVDFEIASTEEFDTWLNQQAPQVREMIATRLVRVSAGLFGDHHAVGGKVSELRFHAGPGYRVYYTIQGRLLVVLLCGGTKKGQGKDVKRAQELAADL